MKILHILISRGWNAQTANASMIIEQQIKQGHQITVFALANSRLNEEQKKKGKKDNPSYENHPDFYYFKGRDSLKLSFILANLLRKDEVDVIHIHGITYGRFRTWLAFKLARKKVPVFFSTRDKAQRKFANNFFWGYYKKFLVPNKLVESYYQELVGDTPVENLPLQIFPAPVDTQKFSPVVKGKPKDKVKIGMFARFDPVKGYPYFFEACRLLLKNSNLPDCEFLIAGFNFEERQKEIRQMINYFNLEGKVKILGNLKNIEEIIPKIDIGVIASIGSEEISRIALEYMSCGVPVIATKIGGIPECMSTKEGILVKPRSAVELQDALLRLVTDKELRLKMGKNGRKKMEKENSIALLCEQLEENYQEAINFFRQYQIYCG